MASYFLDTNVCIFALKGQYPSISEELRKRDPQDVKLATIVEAELFLGAWKSENRARVTETVEAFVAPFEKVAFDSKAAREYARLRSRLEEKGTPIGPNDAILAATVLARRGTLVTHNTKEFRRVPKLRVTDWCR